MFPAATKCPSLNLDAPSLALFTCQRIRAIAFEWCRVLAGVPRDPTLPLWRMLGNGGRPSALVIITVFKFRPTFEWCSPSTESSPRQQICGALCGALGTFGTSHTHASILGFSDWWLLGYCLSPRCLLLDMRLYSVTD